jgi:HD superfamily phosphohydrolase
MGEKLRQITDTIHQTVYLSELESSMMSTAYFYRLHDVYQNSTVYLTYPSNRTKRYEHSYGTMEIAGQMFFSATTNTEKANKAIIAELLEKAEDYLKIIVTEQLSGKEQRNF